MSLYSSGDYDGAYSVFAIIRGYKDVDKLLSTDKNLKTAGKAVLEAKWSVGNYVTFGTYPDSSNKTTSGKAAGIWWLRSPGYFQGDAACVLFDGSLSNLSVGSGHYCDRPALWVNLDSDIFQSGN